MSSGRRFASSRRWCLGDSRRRFASYGERCFVGSRRRWRCFANYGGRLVNSRMCLNTRRWWVVDTRSRLDMCNESGRPMALATMPPHAFSIDMMKPVSPDICSHLVSEPAMTVPVVPVIPIPPVPVELMVVDTMVMRWKEERIFRGYTDDHPWYHTYGDRYPGSIVHSRSEPVAIVITIPEAPKEIDTKQLWHHVNISIPAGNDDHFRWCGKLQTGWRWNFSLYFEFRRRGRFLGWRRRWQRRWRNGNMNVHVCHGADNRH